MIQAISGAKVNLCLHVVGQNTQAYHLLESVVIFTQWGDKLTITPAPQDDYSLSGAYTDLAFDRHNLIIKARTLFEDYIGQKLPPHHMYLEKNIPMGAGLGGGSGNAATALRLYNQLISKAIPEKDLLDIALKIGADVPVCLLAQNCLMQGIGETITPLPMQKKRYSILLHKPPQSLETKHVFNALTHKNNLPFVHMPLPDMMTYALTQGRNDLTPPACNILPILETILHDLKPDSLKTDMTGSGSCCFAIYEDEAIARFHAKRMQNQYKNHFNQLTFFYF